MIVYWYISIKLEVCYVFFLPARPSHKNKKAFYFKVRLYQLLDIEYIIWITRTSENEILYSGESQVPELGKNKVRHLLCFVLRAGFFTAKLLTVLCEAELRREYQQFL